MQLESKRIHTGRVIELDVDTVRKWLKDAAEMLPGPITH